MSQSRDLHRGTTRVLSAFMVLLGVAMIVQTLANGGGALGRGIVLGVLFIAAGLGRLYLNERGRLRRRS
ncbi:hypothetical protein FSW04_19210 [Baekduia soli]|uniref:Uncharacterized protein n=1 Tax=Baekduia soli TaxID=496014 RepID=A0A5B8U8U8_9ACTN|nr:hypothetical protein [Baekduia soli]QEC49484.1 hypothetical protein FSW04_19210 [Baekduia soli]